jgi:hypothetical protein
MITLLVIDSETVRGSYVGDPINLQKPAPSIRSNLRFGIEAETLKRFSIRQIQIGVADCRAQPASGGNQGALARQAEPEFSLRKAVAFFLTSSGGRR